MWDQPSRRHGLHRPFGIAEAVQLVAYLAFTTPHSTSDHAPSGEAGPPRHGTVEADPVTTDDPIHLGREGVYVDVHVHPGSRRPGVVGLHGDAVKIGVGAPPTEGRANQEVVTVVAGLFDVPTDRVTLVSGHRSRRKRLLVEGLDPDQARRVVDGLRP